MSEIDSSDLDQKLDDLVEFARGCMASEGAICSCIIAHANDADFYIPIVETEQDKLRKFYEILSSAFIAYDVQWYAHINAFSFFGSEGDIRPAIAAGVVTPLEKRMAYFEIGEDATLRPPSVDLALDFFNLLPSEDARTENNRRDAMTRLADADFELFPIHNGEIFTGRGDIVH